MTRIVGLAVSVVALVLSSGCATSLGAQRTAKVLKPGQIEAVYGSGISLPVGLAWTSGKAAFDAASRAFEQTQSGQQPTLDVETAQNLGVALAAFILQPPSFVQELDVRYGLVERLDLGLRVSGSSARLEGFGQILDAADWKIAGGLGVAYHFGGSSVLEWLSDTKLAKFSRFDVDGAVLFGQGNDFFHFWFGPKVVFTSIQASGILFGTEVVQVAQGVNLPAVDLDVNLGPAWTYGGVAGIRVGWKYLYVSAELGVFGSSFSPRILGKTFDLGGLVVYPSLAVAGNWGGS